MKLLTGKYFNDKEQIVDCLSFLLTEDYVQDEATVAKYLSVSCQQIQKVSGHYNDFKNVLIKSTGDVFQKPIRV